jgi:Tfp pilus assembly protein PilV
VSLVALCFVTVLAISLASYIAVCSRSMQLSNRAFQGNLSQQLAEAGIEEALRAFSKNDWSNWSSNGYAATWTLDTANRRASGTLSFPAGKLGQGATATVKLRVDNYDAATLGATWSNTKDYRASDLVGWNGIWYRCVQTHASSQTPSGIGNLSYWVPDPIPSTWISGFNYKAEDMVFTSDITGSFWRRCITPHTSSSSILPTNGTYWTRVPAVYSSYSSGKYYYKDEVVYYSPLNTWYSCTSNGTGGGGWTLAPISWRWNNSKPYYFNDVVYYAGNWYRYINASTTSGAALSDSNYWENALSGSTYGWLSGVNYNLGDSVFYGSTSQWYRCLKAHQSSGSITPANSVYWSNAPLLSNDWDRGKQYTQNDTVRYNGVWYLSLQNTNVGQNPATAASWWIGATTSSSSYTWNPTSNYSTGSYRCYGGVWYLCTASNTGVSPNDTGYWKTLGAPVVYAEASVAIANNPDQQTQLRAPIAPAPLFPNAIAATTSLNANSGGTIDSYDSTLGAPSPSQYSSQVGTSTNYSAVVAAGSTTGTAITLTSPTISGYLAAPSSLSAPYAPLMALGTSTIVKGSAPTPSPKVNVTRVSRSPSIPQYDTLPVGGLASKWSSVPKGTMLGLGTTINIGTPGSSVPARYYYNGNLTIGNSTVTTLNINGPVILYINGNLSITASGSVGQVNLNPSGSAEIHVAGAFQADAPGNGIVSTTYDPKTLIIICDTPASTNHFYSEGINPLYGVIYAPYTALPSGYFNDNNNANIYGAVSARKVTYSGANMNVHYDTSLRYATFGGVDQPYAATEWRQLPVAEKATMP